MNPEKLTTQVLQILNKEFPGDFIEFVSPRNDNKHFKLTIISEKFSGMPLLKRHRLVYSFLKSMLDSGEIHALNLNLHDRKPSS